MAQIPSEVDLYGPEEKAQQISNQDTLIKLEEFSSKDDSIQKLSKKTKTLSLSQAQPHLREILDSMFPSNKDETATDKRVSSLPAGRDEVLQLQFQLECRLQERQARESGVCPVREELFAQVFDELIRQITIECPERGLLLLRVRDEARMTIASYTTLYESSVIFGMRKGLQAEEGTVELNNEIQQLVQEKEKLESKVQELKAYFEFIEKAEAERRIMEEKKRQKEKDFLRYQSHQLESFLKSQTSQN